MEHVSIKFALAGTVYLRLWDVVVVLLFVFNFQSEFVPQNSPIVRQVSPNCLNNMRSFPQRVLRSIISILLLSCITAHDVALVEMSLDDGKTWIPSQPNSEFGLTPHSVLFRLRDSDSFISLPSCAAQQGPASFEWRGLRMLAVNTTVMCTKSVFEHRYVDPQQLAPDWHAYLRDPKAKALQTGDGKQDGDEQSDDNKKSRLGGLWSRYGLYIVGFVVFSLIQGIREGNAEYRKEQEHEKRAAEVQQASNAKTSIVVPRRKGKTKKASGSKK